MSSANLALLKGSLEPVELAMRQRLELPNQPIEFQAYLDEFAFRHNRRKTKGVGRIAARVIEGLVARKAMTMRSLIDTDLPPKFHSGVSRVRA